MIGNKLITKQTPPGGIPVSKVGVTIINRLLLVLSLFKVRRYLNLLLVPVSLLGDITVLKVGVHSLVTSLYQR